MLPLRIVLLVHVICYGQKGEEALATRSYLAGATKSKLLFASKKNDLMEIMGRQYSIIVSQNSLYTAGTYM